MKVTTKQLAELFQVTPATIANWTKDGMPKVARGEYDVRDCFTWKADQEIARKTREFSADGQTEGELELRKLAADVALKEIQVEKERNNLTTHEAVEQILIGYLEPLRTMILQIPSSWPTELLGIENKEEMQLILERMVDDLLQKASSGPSLPDFSEIIKLEQQLEEEDETE